MNIVTIDAKNKKIGRVASEAAVVLMGKDSPEYARNKVGGRVEIINTSGLLIDNKKKDEKIYKHYSGYPSGLKEETMAKVIEKKGEAEVLRKAIYGMLPSNKLRAIMMKNLKISK